MKAWMVHDANWEVGFLIYRAPSRSAARVMYMKDVLDITWYDLIHYRADIRAIRYPYADTDNDRTGDVPPEEWDPEDAARSEEEYY